MKKFLIGFGIVVVLLVGILAAIPLFYDIDAKARPIILNAIRENMDVDAELGKLSLNLFGGIKIGVQSLVLKGKTTKATLVQLKNAQLVLPYTALLQGKISATLKAKEPELNVTRYADGSINIFKLLKSKDAKAAQTAEAGGEPSKTSAALASRLDISVDLEKAKVSFNDLQSKINYNISDLDLEADNIGFNQPISLRVVTALSVDNKKDILINGKAKLNGETTIHMNASGFESADLSFNSDLKDLQVKYGSLLNKPKGTDLNCIAKLSSSTEKVHIDGAKLQVASFYVELKGDVQNLQKTPELNLQIKTNDLELSEWKEIIGMVKDFGLKGTVNANVEVTGTTNAPHLNGDVKMRNGQLKMATMKAPIEDIQLDVDMNGDRVDIKKGSLSIANNEVNVSGSLENIATPVVDLKIKSKAIDLNDIMPPSQKADTKKGSAKNSNEPTLAQSMAAPLAMIRGNDYLRKMTLSLDADIKKINYQTYVIEDLKAEAFLKNLNFTLKNTSMKIFKGVIRPYLQVDLAPAKPTYQFRVDMAGLDINSAIVSQFKDLDKSLTGLASGQLIVNGTGIEEADVKRTLKGSAQVNVKNGTWSGASALKSIGEKLSKIPKAGEALGKLEVGDKFKTLTADMIIQNGLLDITKSRADMEETGASVDTTGTIGFDKRLNLKGDILAKINNVPKDLKASDGRAKIPFEIQGMADSPEVNWQKTVGIVAKAYAKDEGKKVLNQQVDKLKDRLLKDENVKKLFKGFKF